MVTTKNVNKVSTDHQKQLKLGQKSTISLVFARMAKKLSVKGQSPLWAIPRRECGGEGGMTNERQGSDYVI